MRAVVRCGAGSYCRGALRYDRASPGTTSWIWVRPCGVGYDPAVLVGPGAARSGARGERLPPAHGLVPVEVDISVRVRRRRRRTRTEMPTSRPRPPGAPPSNRSRCGTEPISARNRTDLDAELDRSRRRKQRGELAVRAGSTRLGSARGSSTRLSLALFSSGRIPRPGRPCGGPRMSSDPRSAPGSAP